MVDRPGLADSVFCYHPPTLDDIHDFMDIWCMNCVKANDDPPCETFRNAICFPDEIDFDQPGYDGAWIWNFIDGTPPICTAFVRDDETLDAIRRDGRAADAWMQQQLATLKGERKVEW